MVQKYGTEPNQGDHHIHVVYTKRTRERQVFMQELSKLRRKKEKYTLKTIKDAIGPKWYQALSVPQRSALDNLEFSIYQDILEGRPVRTANIMKQLGLYPRPNKTDLMNCVYLGRKDPKQMLAHLFLITYGHQFDSKRLEYPLNARLMLSAILYLGIADLLSILKEKFQPDVKDMPPKDKPKLKAQPPLESPYLQNMVAVLYVPPKKEPFRPAPLPNLEDLNEPYEEDPPAVKPPPPLPPPPPPPKKKLARSYCDKLAGIMNIEPYSSVTAMTLETVTRTGPKNKHRNMKMSVTNVKKTYGISMSFHKKGRRRKKLVPPSTGIQNTQYGINGVYTISGKTVFVLGSVCILPPEGDMIHGGYKYMGGDVITVHCGFRGRPPPPKPDPCDCIKKWHDAVFDYIKENKCHCEHYYDYGNEGTFPPQELPYFEKPTKYLPYKFNYDTIYDLDDKNLLVRKEFKQFWDNDSLLHIGETGPAKPDKKKKKIKRSSSTCLGQQPTPEDYLRCALRHLRRVNIAAKLPDIHLVPELKEWMRRRIYGPFSRSQKHDLLKRSIAYWQTLLTLVKKGFGHVSPRKNAMYTGLTSWEHKQKLNDSFREFTKQYKLDLFRSYASVTNMMWPTMCQTQFPDKKFREIYFSYLFSRIEDLQLMHPYSTRETMERANIISKKRYRCPHSIKVSQ